MTRRRQIAVVAVAGLLALAGCGGSSDEDQAQATVETFMSGIADHDAEVVCGVYPDDSDALLTSDGYDLLSDDVFGGGPCTATLEDSTEVPGLARATYKELLDAFRFEDVTSVEVEGDEARVETESGITMQLIKSEDGTWLIDDPGLS